MSTWHILPIDDLKPHEEASTCPCHPEVKVEGGDLLVIHNAFDGREGVEWTQEILGHISPSQNQP
jgi:hypothetical protein